jgi:hypothetical protein
MHVELNRLTDYPGRPLLCVTHSDRPMHEPSTDLNYLERRFGSPLRLPPSQPFETLEPASAFTPFLGAVTVYDIGTAGDRPPELVCAFRPGTYKPSHAMWHADRLWVLGTEHIEVYDAHLNSVRAIRDPWLAGAHTIVPDDRGRVLVSCSASDAILAFDQATGDLAQVWRVPEEWYGRNYPLARGQSVVDHYIHNDLQLTHINCAWPWRGGLLVSLLIQGAIGWSDGNGGYREIVRGFVGCHGVRVRSDIEEIYFADSCSGMVVFLDLQGTVIRRVGTGSRWLHDAVQVRDDLFAVAPFDHNDVVLLNVATREVVCRIPCAGRGGPQFLSFGGPQAGSPEPRFPIGSHAAPGAPDEAELRRRHAAMILARDEMVRDQAETARARDALVAELRQERDLAVTTRDAIIAAQQAEQAREVGTRDAIIADLHAQQAREVGTRDAMLADLTAARDRDIAAHDEAIAALRAEHARDVASRQAMIDVLRRDLEGATRGWRRWIAGRRRGPS